MMVVTVPAEGEMEEQLTVITRKNQITLPARFMRRLGLRQGDKVAVVLNQDDEGELRLRPVHSVTEALFGAFHRPDVPTLDVEEGRRQFEEAAGREVESPPREQG
jgi:AbrB family looped-hinge helix DNA binding protein